MMNPEKQREAIAVACGWRKIDGLNCSLYHFRCWVAPGVNEKEHWKFRVCPPSYLDDHTAMNEVLVYLFEKGIRGMRDGQALSSYALQLDLIINRDHRGECTHRRLIATAAQQAEAFLKALNLWEE